MSKNTNLSFLTDFITADIVNTRVGINNASPQTTFDVTGTGKFSGILTLGSTISNGTYAYTLPSATGTLALTSQIPANAVGGTGTINTIPKFTAASTIGNSNIFDSGSIIYNTNPAAGQFAWQFGGSTVTGQSYGAQVLAGTNSSDTAFRVLNASASSTYLLVRGDGNVGIGTTLPSAGLEIETDGSAKTALRVTSNQAFNASPVTAIMFRYRISSGTTIGGAVINAAKDNATENNQAGNLQFWTNNGSTLAERMQISSGGNVGIGVTPSVWGSAFKAIQILNQASISAEADLIASSVNAFYDTSWKYIANGVATNYYQNNGQHVWRNATSGTAGNAITWSVPMTLTSGGNLLVGTTTDNGAKLQVSGTATFSSSVTASIFDSTSNAFRFNGSNALSLVTLSGQNVVKINAAGYWGSQIVGANDQGILVNNVGNVGIGTTTPDVTGFGWRTLTIRGGTTSGEAGVIELQSPTTTGAANLGIIAFMDGSNRNAQIYSQRASSTTTGNILFATNGGSGLLERMQINSRGDIQYNGNSTNVNAGAYIENTNTDLIFYASLSGSVSKNMRFFYNGGTGEGMRITSGGNVSIGTPTDTGYKLYVLGAAGMGVSSSVTANNYIANTQGLNVAGYGFLTQTISGQMTILGHNLAASTSVANQVNVVNGGWYSSMIKMYYSAGITFHTSSTVYSAGDVYPMDATERIKIKTNGEVIFHNSIILRNGQINSLTSSDSGQSMYLNFQGNGAIYAGSSYTVLYAGSDERIKTEINHSQSTLTKILNLTPRTFKYKERPEITNYGFIAQEVEKIMPELVRTSEGITMCLDEQIENQKSVESYGLAWASILVKAIQEQQQQIQELKNKLS